MYEAEKAIPQEEGQPSTREKFINIFPYTIKDESKKAIKGKIGERSSKRKKGKKVTKRKGE